MRRNILLVLLLAATTWMASAQSRKVTGQVKDAKGGESLPGVSVVLQGTQVGTLTDIEGNYSLQIPEGQKNPTLSFSFIGYQTQTVAVGKETLVNVDLVGEEKVLDQVVVVGYESVNRRDVMGSVSSVNDKQLRDVPITNAAEALTGRLAGVQVTSTEGGPGADVVIRIRGGGSITQDNSPIYIVDGIQVENALSVISPQDIASIDVLKDASTTAIYGARGANGVVIITTKGGKAGKTTVTYNGSYGYRQIAKTMDVLDPYEFVVWQYERGKLNNDSTNIRLYGSTWDTLGVYKNMEEINWQEKVFGRQAGYQNHNLAISGGSQNTTYNLSLTNNQEEGILLQSGFTRRLANFKLDHKAKNFNFGFTARYLNQRIDGAGTTNSGTRTTNRLRHTIQYRPFDVPTLPDADAFDEEYFVRSGNIINPVLLTEAEYRRNYTNNINLSGYFSYNLAKNLTFKSTVGYDNATVTNNLFYSKITGTARNFASLPVASIGTRNDQTLNNNNVLQYDAGDLLGKKHKLSVLVGQELYQFNTQNTGIETRFFPADISPEKALSNMGLGSAPTGSAQPLPTSFVAPPSRVLSFFGRVNYAFDRALMASVSVRADRSSKFSYDNGSLLFPSGSVAYRFSQLKALSGLKFLSEGKVRVGFGTAGNNRIGDLLYRQLYSVSGITAINHTVVPGFAPSALANPNLKWERTVSQNIGLDLGFLDNRIQVTIDAYKNVGKDLLLAVAIPPVSGYTTQLRNVGSTSNRGLEIQVNGDIIRKKDFRWSSNFNISFNRNRVENLGGLTQQTRNAGWQGSDGADDYLVKVGESIGLIYGFVTDGWYKIEDFDYNATTGVYTLKSGIPNAAFISGTIRPGALKIKDINGDGVITTDGDRTVIGNAQAKFTGGWNNQIQYKGFDFSVFLNFVYGNDVYNANDIEWTDGSFPNLNMLAKMKDRFRYVNDQGEYVTAPEALAALNANAKIWTPTNANRFFNKSSNIEDGSFLRVNNVTLGYTLPTVVTSRLRMSNLRIYGTVNNLAVFTKYSGYDPEVTARRTDPLTPGVDFAAYPRARVYVFGINASF